MVFLFYLRIFTVIFPCMRVHHVECGVHKEEFGESEAEVRGGVV